MAGYIQLPDGSYFQLKPGQDAMDGFYAASQLYPDAFGTKPQTPKAPEEKGLIPALKGSFQTMKGEAALTAGKLGLMDEAEAQKYYEQQKTKAYKPTEEGWLEAPLLKTKELIGGALPYMAAPFLAGAAVEAAPITGLAALAAGAGATGLTSAGQFVGSNLARQVEEGKSLKETDLGAAALAAIPQAALDTVSLRMMPGLSKVLGVSENVAKNIAEQGLKKAAVDYSLATGKAMGVEGLTESAQQVLERAQAGLNIADPEARKEYFDNFIGGAVLGGTIALPGRKFERMGMQARYDKQQKETADARYAAEEAEKNRPENLLKLFDEYTAAKEEAIRLKDAIPAAPNKKKKSKEYEQWEESTAGAREAASDFMESVLSPLRRDYTQREDLIKPLVAQRQAEQAAAQPAAAPEPVFTAPTVTDLMDQYDALNQQRDDIGAQMQEAAAGGDPQAIITLHDQWQALTKYIDQTGKAVEAAGGTTETAVALDKKLDTAQKEMAKAAEVGDFDAVRKQAEKLAALQDKRKLVGGRAPSTAVVEQPETTTPATTEEPAEPTTPQVPLLENKPLSVPKYVFPDGTVATTPYDVERYEEEQFQKKYAPQIIPAAVPETQLAQPELFENTPLEQAKKFVLETNKATVSHIAEGLGIKRPEAAALIQQLEKEKVVSPLNKRNQREVLRGTPAIETPATPTKPETAAPAEAVEQPQTKPETAAPAEAAPAEAAPVPQGSLAQEAQGSLFREQGEKPAVGMRVEEVDTHIAPFRELPVAPKIETVQSVTELPPEIQAQMERDGTQGAPGMYHPPTKTIYMVGDNLIDARDAGKTIAHELVGHFGLRGVLDKQYPAVMRAIYQNSKQVRAEANARMQRNPNLSQDVATEESIAERAENDVSLTWMHRLVNLIRTKLRQWGIWRNAPIGESEIIRLIRDSHKYVHGVTTKPSETVRTLAKIAPTEADIKGHNRVEALYSGRGQKNFKEPVKTIKAYKIFRVKKNEPGKIYPLFIGKNEATAIGEWVPAEHLPTKGFAERPGWHAGILPMAPHLRTKENQMADDRVWAEVEIPADVNWQDVADTQKTRDIRDRVPVGGHYRFKTSKMQGGAWIIGGALKVNRVLSNKEIADILNNAGEKDAATREQMRNPALAEAFAPTGTPAAKANDVLYRERKPTKSVVAQRTSAVDDLMSLVTGLTGASSREATLAGIKDKTDTRALKLRLRVFDQYAPLVAAVTKGVDAKVIDALRAQNLMYFLRFGQQRSDIAGQTITSGPPRVRSEKTKNGVEYFYENEAGGPTLVGMAQALEKAKGYKEQERENAFTVYLAGKRAEQVGWNKLRFDNPVEAENEYKAVLAHLKQNKADEAAFKEAEKIYQNYNAGLLDFLVQTGAMSKQKAEELKQITYVPFYRVDKDGNIRMETGDERRAIRIGNIKDEPRLKELLGDSEQILPVFTSAIQNTNMLINMAMRNQTVKDTAFVLKDLGIASRIVASKGPYADNVVHFRVHGVEHHAIIDNDMYGIPAQMIVEGLEGIKLAMPAIVRMLGVPGDIFRKFTVRNPLYMFRQLVRDPVAAWVQNGTSTVPILDSFSTLAKMATGKDTTAQRLQRAGATSSNVLVGDARDMTKFL